MSSLEGCVSSPAREESVLVLAKGSASTSATDLLEPSMALPLQADIPVPSDAPANIEVLPRSSSQNSLEGPMTEPPANTETMLPSSSQNSLAGPPDNNGMHGSASINSMHGSASINSMSGVIEAVAHVYAADVGVSLHNETVDAIHYDDANQLLMVTKGGVVFAYDLAMDAPGHHEQLVWTYPVQEGPRVMAVRCSLDRQLLGCLRGGTLLELIDLATGNTSVYKSSEHLLGFFFTEAPGTDVVLVGRSGLELCEYVAQRRGLRCREKLRPAVAPGRSVAGPVAWYSWTHETRCCLISTGPPPPLSSFSSFTSAGPPQQQPQFLQAWQFVSAGLVALPPFAVGAEQSAAATAVTAALMSAGPAALPISIRSVMQPPVGPPAAVSQKHVRLIKAYGRVYCACVNVATSKLELYRFYTDTVALQHSLELFSTNIDISVVDNVIVLHHLDTAMTVLVDIASTGEVEGVNAVQQPVANPLPLAIFSPPPPPPRQPLPASAPLSPPAGQQLRQQERRLTHQPRGARGLRSSGPAELYSWEFIAPATVIDRGPVQAVYRLYIDLRAVAASCGDPVLLASFLQRRRSPPLPELSVAPKVLLQVMLRSCLQDALPLLKLRKVFHQVCRGWQEVRLAARSSRGLVPPAASAAVLSPEQITKQVFVWYLQRPNPDLVYLQSAVSELMATAAAVGILLPGALLACQLDVMAMLGLSDQVALAVCFGAQASVETDLGSASSAATRPSLAERDYVVDSMAAAAGASAPVGECAVKSGAAVTLDAAACLRQRRAAANAASQAAAVASSSSSSRSAAAPALGAARVNPGAAEGMVRQLLAEGQVLSAARVARRLHVTAVHPREMLVAAAAERDDVAFAAVYRCFRSVLIPSFPKLEVARAQLM